LTLLKKEDWPNHKSDCIPPEQRPKYTEDDVVGFVECETYEDCRDYLIKHPQIINKIVSDEMFQKGYLALRTHPPGTLCTSKTTPTIE
jgi:hypothetical protein